MSSFSYGKAVHGFTLSELLIGMIISGIVISAVWAAIQVVSNLAQTSFSSRAQIEEVSFFKRCISSDFHRAEDIVESEDGVRMSFQYPVNDVKYRFTSEYVVRSGDGKTDSFHLQVFDISVFNSGGTDALNDGKIDELKCKVVICGAPQDLVISRTSTSRDKMSGDD